MPRFVARVNKFVTVEKKGGPIRETIAGGCYNPL